MPLLFSNQTYSQEEVVGSWIISSEHTYDIGGYKNYQLIFNENEIIEPDNYHILNENQSGEWDFVFSLGAYQCDGTLDLYLTDNYYYNTNQIEWPNLYDIFENYRGDAQIIRTNEINKYLLFCYGEINASTNYSFQFVEIDVTNPIPIFEENEFPLNYPNLDVNKSPKGFIISNKKDGIGSIFVISTSPSDPLSGSAGLERYSIEDNEVSYEETLISDDNNDGILTEEDYYGYNLEMQNKNETEEPKIAWIISPLKVVENCKIFIYDSGVNDEHYCLDFSQGNPDLVYTGRIAGIEFSPFPDEENFMYVSCEMLGLIKINWHTGELIEQYTQGEDMDFSHSHVQTAPDGNIYVVSNDGSRLGKIDKTGDHLLDINAFTYPVSGNAYLRHINIANNEDDEDPIKYYTLPENDFRKLNAKTITTDNLCDIESGSASIIIYDGVPEYTLVYVKDESGNDVTGLFNFNPQTNSFDAPNIDEGTYSYKISDESECEYEYTGTFTIAEGDIYDFEQDLLEIDENASTEIYGLEDMVWDANDNDPENGFLIDNTIMFKHGFVLKDNQTLTINNLRLEFDEDYLAKVIIEPGSKLILNNCTLTNYHCWDPDAKWAGIEVWGNYNMEQTDANQGRIELNNTIIEHAHEAVQLWEPGTFQKTGGKIYAENSTFTNNRRALVIMSYVWEHPAEEILFYYDYNSIIENCIFENNDDYISDNGFYSFVSMFDVKGVKFRGCTFNSGGHNAVGIDAIDAGFYIRGICDNGNGCDEEQWQKTNFYNFDKAIYARNSGSDAFYPINIMHSYFHNNNFGAHLYNLHDVLKLNTSVFVVGNNGETKEKAICGEFFGRGIHIEESNGFEIENNEFVKNTAAELDDDVIGILAKENPSNHDIIFNNKFTGLKIGNRAYGFNRYEDDQGASDPWGLEYQCNQNTNNTIDFEVVSYRPIDAKIRENIGYTNISARNTFTSTSYEGLEWHWRNMGYEQENYYLHISEENTNMEPHDDYIQTSDDIETLFTKVTPNNININQCPDGSGIQIERTTLTPEEIEELEIEFAIAYQDYEAVESIYNDLTDGGSTETTSLTIETAQPDDTWELRDNLLGKSPYLSREVLEKAANKTEVLPNSVLLDILAANPDELKKEDFIRFLENKEEPLPDYMISILREISVGTTYKTALLNQMGLNKRKQLNAANRIIKSLINSEEQNVEVIKGWLANRENLQSDLQIAGILIKEGNYSSANELLNSLPDIYDIDGDALDLYLDDKYLLTLKMNLLQENRTLSQLNSAEIAQLETIADNESGMAKAAARIVLEAFYGYDEYCDCMSEGGSKSTNAGSLKMEEESPLKIEASPNPATHYVDFYYELSEIDKEGVISISDVNGKIIQIFKIKYIKGIQAWDTRNIPAGSYIYTLKTKYFEQSDKLIIQ